HRRLRARRRARARAGLPIPVAALGYERNLGLPEVQLGIHPGFGGTVRLVRLLGAPRALDLVLSGRSLSPVEAHKPGLGDPIAERDALERTAIELIERQPPPRRAEWWQHAFRLEPVRRLFAARVRPQIAKRADPRHYPAPYALLELWVRHGGRGEAAYAAEAKSVGELLVSRTSKNLVRMFLLRERMRNLAPKEAAVERVH